MTEVQSKQTLRHPGPIFWKNGVIVEQRDAQVSVLDHGLLYGDGVFEGLRFFHNTVFQASEHLCRLQQSLLALEISSPYSNDTLIQGMQNCIEEFHADKGYLRLVITRGEGALGVDCQSCHSPNAFIIADALSIVDEQKVKEGIHLICASIRRCHQGGIDPRIKSLNYLTSVLARQEANRLGADEALLLNTHGHIAECSAENIFMLSGDSLLTPRIEDGALDGITRQTIMLLARQLGLRVIEKALVTYDIEQADMCFICGSGAGIIPIRTLNGKLLSRYRLPQSDGSAQAITAYNHIVDAHHALIESACGTS